MTFKDHFSGHAAEYAAFRPRYPAELFRALAELAPGRALAWDCATGNGQAARGLAEHFARVVASDASERQIAQAQSHPRVRYLVARESCPELEDATVDLLTVAQAMHWLDADALWREARRVLRDGGVAAIWCYGLARIAPEIDEAIARFYRDEVGPYWPPERRHIESGYRDLDFPFEQIETPVVEMVHTYDLDAFCAYVRTWSAVKRYQRARGEDPVAELHAELRPSWGEGSRQAVWTLSLRAGRHRAAGRRPMT